MSQRTNPPEYVLGTGDDELARLSQQHRLWSDAALAAWKRAGIDAGRRVLDVGCGPGYAAMDVAQIVGPAGAVVGVDESPNFIAFLDEQARFRRLTQLRGIVGDVQNLPAALGGEKPFDLIYARWVLCFVPDPEAVIRGIAAALRPGGRVVIHDYFNYTSMTAAPRRNSHDKAVAATFQSWKQRGGDPDICGRAPKMLHTAGLRVEHITVHSRIARGGEAMFQWPLVWWRTFAPKLVEKGLLAQADCDELLRDLDEIAADPTQFIQCPPVYEIIAAR